jgi:hypothetical protein
MRLGPNQKPEEKGEPLSRLALSCEASEFDPASRRSLPLQLARDRLRDFGSRSRQDLAQFRRSTRRAIQHIVSTPSYAIDANSSIARTLRAMPEGKTCKRQDAPRPTGTASPGENWHRWAEYSGMIYVRASPSSIRRSGGRERLDKRQNGRGRILGPARSGSTRNSAAPRVTDR